ncbi:MAG: hypothetical protein IJQ12_02970 [Lachnospiraceae bacterium]|nr:hypothetical protein [Lachnospiraceae bacterium]
MKTEKLRNDLKEYFKTAASFGFSRKLIEVDLRRVDEADEEGLIAIAKEQDIDLSEYEDEA